MRKQAGWARKEKWREKGRKNAEAISLLQSREAEEFNYGRVEAISL